MSEKRMTVGYCPMCGQNVDHTRKFSSLALALLDAMTLKVLSLFRIGPWYCYQCEQKSLYLRPVNRQAPTFHTERAQVSFDLDGTSLDRATETTESVGNFLRNEHSLVMREKRARRFSEKFRDATVSRILSGASTIAQVRQELNVQEIDVMDWIANLLARKQARIDELHNFIRSLRDDQPNRLKIDLQLDDESPLESENAPGEVIEGRILPK